MELNVQQRRGFYAGDAIQRRIGEFLGGRFPDGGTAVYFAPGTESESMYRRRYPLKELPGWLNGGSEINRSLWDHEYLLAHLDIEYVNFDRPGEIYLDPERGFSLQQPVQRAVKDILFSYGIRPLHLLTGRGHHFVWQVRRESEVFQKLAGFGRLSDTLERLYENSPAPTGELVEPELGKAFAGLGLVMEYLAHQVKTVAAGECEIPVEMAAIEVGADDHGREMVSVDITEYADPLIARAVRVPFSVYLKPRQQTWKLGSEAVDSMPPIFSIPMPAGVRLGRALQMMREVGKVNRLAERSSTRIPDASEAMERLVEDYAVSRLRKFHDWFYEAEHDPADRWPETYDRTDLSEVPPCVRLILEKPNDLLLRPACAERVVRVMLALGWHPRHIGGLIRSKYEREHHEWGEQWFLCDPATRADFYARLFSGLFATGVDDLVDFNCRSAQEENLCLVADCGHDIGRFRESLLHRRQHERLGHRPFHGLFLPEEHL
ncbi:hypothetical protein [Verrucomicrobium spinosum]|uniref:hypothetical protein n=1 Tax=Verrucomicrobium spinosum TaxID=2736 RepID=UPI0001744B96|nr:hypothetical protein [Verrucomicrobium spinosum]